MILETERLILREFSLDDAAAFYRMNSNPQVVRYTGETPLTSIEQARETLMKFPLRDYRVRGFGRWACIYKENSELIGFNGCKYNKILKLTEIGYRFVPEYWRMGLATESSLAVLRYFHEVMGMKDIAGIIDPENNASAAVLRKIGLKFDRIELENGVEVAVYVYAE